jgi:uncharacterized protein YdaL
MPGRACGRTIGLEHLRMGVGMPARRDITFRGGGRRLGFLVSALVVVLLAGLAGSALSSPGARGADKPPRPPKEHPTKKGLVRAIAPNVTVGDAAVQAAVTAVTSGTGIPGAVGRRTLVLYDTTGDYGWLGELYAISSANLVSHFGPWTAKPVVDYQAGELSGYDAVLYLGSTYDEPVPDAFLDDVYASTKPVVWVYDNIWRLTARFPDFETKYGWMWAQFDLSPVSSVVYEGVTLTRDAVNNGAGIMSYWDIDPGLATVVAEAVRADGTRFPWAIRSGSLTYVGENPFVYVSETDRLLAFEDMLFDALDPTAPVRHRALIRLEDLSPATDADEVRAAADYLSQHGVPFGFGVIASYRDPLAVENPQPTTTPLAGSELEALIAYLQARGGVSLMHGYTHQYDATANPYNGVTGDDFELYRVSEAADHSLVFEGPVAEDSQSWALGRIDAAAAEFRAAGLAIPQVYVTPHYTASVADYLATAQRFGTRWERTLYFGGTLSGGTLNYGRVIGQMFPFVVRDVYGTVVLPENVGNYEPEPFYTYPVHTVADILSAADANEAVRDGFASVYYHAFNGVAPLAEIVSGLQARGWTFVDPADVAGIVELARPVVTTAPIVSGTAAIGQVLTTTNGTWEAQPAVTAYAYRWLRCDAAGNACVPITGATAAAYTVQVADGGRTLRSEVSATNAVGTTAATSAQTAVVPAGTRPVNTALPVISGIARVGRTLTATAGSWTATPPVTQIAYRWQRCSATGTSCSNVAGATSATYLVKSADRNRTLRVRVTATNAVGSTVATSNRTAVVTR